MHEYSTGNSTEQEKCVHEGQNACSHNCANCGGDPKQEAKALMEYMVKHNRAHCRELEQLAKNLQKLDNQLGYEQLMQAVADFEKGNLRLAAVLAAMGE